MDPLTFVRDLGRDVPRPGAADLAAARARLLAELEDAPSVLPVRRGDAAAAPAPVVPIEERRGRMSRFPAIALAAAATVAVAAAAIGGVALLRELGPDDRVAGPTPTTTAAPTPDPTAAPADAPYTRLTRTIETNTPWTADGDTTADAWARAGSAVSTRATETLSVPRDPRGPEPWVWRVGACEIAGTAGEPVDPNPVLELCTLRDLKLLSGWERSATWEQIVSGEAAQTEALGTVPLPLLDGGYGVWDELPRDPAALLEWYRSRAGTFESTWIGVMTEALALNQMPEDLAAAMLEAVSLAPGAETTRDAPSGAAGIAGRTGITGLVVPERLGDGVTQTTTLTVDATTGLVSMVQERSHSVDPGALAAELPGGGRWSTRITITAVPAAAPDAGSGQDAATAGYDVDDATTWDLTAQGAGPLQLGASLTEVADQLGTTVVPVDDTGCTAMPDLQRDGTWVPVARDDRIVAISYVDRSGTLSGDQLARTVDGFSFASSAEELSAAYGPPVAWGQGSAWALSSPGSLESTLLITADGAGEPLGAVIYRGTVDDLPDCLR